MSAKAVHKCYLTCDTCGFDQGELYDDATTARIAAAAYGWTYVQYTRRIGGSRKQAGPRTWDACANCEVPPTVEDAYAVVQSRAAQAGGAS